MKTLIISLLILSSFSLYAQQRILPNGKAVLNKRLPKSTGGHVLMLREQHDQSSHLKYIDEHLEELKKEHRLQTLGLELPPFVMIMLWNYSDAFKSPKDKKEARKIIEDLHAFAYDENWQLKKSLILHALDLDIAIICMDSRNPYDTYVYTSTERLKRKYEDIYRKYSNSTVDSIKHEMFEIQKQYQTQKLYESNRKYRKRIDAIDKMIKAMDIDRMTSHKVRIEHDVISATIFTALADISKNAIIVYGGGHMDGLIYDTVIYKAQGILDESIAATGWTVSDGIANNASEIESRRVWAQIGEHLEYCKFDHIDFVWAIDLDIVAYPPLIPNPAIKEYPLGLDYDMFSCIEGNKIDYSYYPERLDPQLDPSLNQFIHQLNTLFNISAPTALNRR